MNIRHELASATYAFFQMPPLYMMGNQMHTDTQTSKQYQTACKGGLAGYTGIWPKCKLGVSSNRGSRFTWSAESSPQISGRPSLWFFGSAGAHRARKAPMLHSIRTPSAANSLTGVRPQMWARFVRHDDFLSELAKTVCHQNVPQGVSESRKIHCVKAGSLLSIPPEHGDRTARLSRTCSKISPGDL